MDQFIEKVKTITRIKPKTFDKKAALEWLTKTKALENIKFGDSVEEIEEANKQFSNYKEGWKTDMGMMYILFGPPWYIESTLEMKACNALTNRRC